MVEEIWKVIEDSDGHYFISNLGHMKRDDYICYDAKGRKLKRKAKYWTTGNFNKKNGYYSYAFRGADGTRQKNYVHRLVGLHFIKNPFPEEYNQINHIDGDKSNNIASNLEWVNTKKNMEHASKHGLINRDSELRKITAAENGRIGSKKTRKFWCKYDKEGNLVEVLHGKGRRKLVDRLTYKGYTWRSGEILQEKYGEIPEKLDVSYSFEASTNTRKYYIATYPDGKQEIYTKLRLLPISRDTLWYCFNHQISDEQNRMWDIKIAEKGALCEKRKILTKKIIGRSEQKTVYFNSQKDCLDFLEIKGCSGLLRAIKNHSLYHGYYWEVVTNE